jgi:branched-chain amino acid transport system substrate-binding protein
VTRRGGRLAAIAIAVGALATGHTALAGTTTPVDSSPADSAAPATGEPIVVGLSKGITGWWSAFDAPGLLGAEIAVDEINAAGGVGGRPFELQVCDAKSDVNQAAACGVELVEDGVDMMLVTCDYDFGGPPAREANRVGMISIGCAGHTGFGVEGIGPYHYNTYAGNPAEAATIVEYGYNELGFRRPYLLRDETIEYSKNLCELVEEHWNTVAGEGTIAGIDTFLNDDPSISGQISRIASSDADSLIVCSFIPGGSSALRQIRGAGIDLPIFGTSSFDGDYWIEAVPDLSDFHYPAPLSEWGDPTDNPLVDAVIERTGEPPDVFTYLLHDYSAMYILKSAIEQAGGATDGDSLKAVLDTWVDEPTPTGPTTYTPECHIPLDRPFGVVEIEGGVRTYLGDYQPESIPPSSC